MNWRDLGDTTLAIYEQEFRRYNSPMLGEVAAIYEAAKPHSALALAMMWVEQKYATLSSIPADYKNPLSQTRPGATSADGLNRWMRFSTFAQAVEFWKNRLTSPTGPYKDTVTVEDLIHIYAPGFDNNNEAEYVGHIRRMVGSWPNNGAPPMARPKILLTRGHGTTGDTGAIVGAHAEETYNRRIVPAIAKALRAAGYDVTTYPADPTQDVPGTLDTEGAYARQWIAQTPGEVVMLDCHLESSSARGIFAIVANDIGLGTGAAGAQPATDTFANNAGDRALGKAICEEISRLTGVPIRTGWVKEPGLMSEDMTYVGGMGWRLAMFGYTAEFHQRAYRLIVEFANLQNDAAFFTRADFADRCGQGVVLAMNRIFGVTDEPATPETPKYAKPKPIAALARLDAGDRAGLDAVSLKEGGSFTVFRREVEATKRTPRYQVANARSKARVGPDIEPGERFVPAWRFTAEDGTEWYLSAAWTRILAADVAVVDDVPAQAA